MFHIRRADEEDWQDILDADRICFPDDYPTDMTEGEWWIAETDEGQLAAYAAACMFPDRDDTVQLTRCGVMPTFRGCGLQRRLIVARERWGRKMGATWAVSDTYRNPVSANNFIRCGYTTFLPGYEWAGSSAIYWTKVL